VSAGRAGGGVVLALIAALMVPVRGQQPAAQNTPRTSYVYPAGGRQGTTVQAVVAGQFLDGISDVLVSGRGVKASFVGLDKPMNQRQIQELRDQLQQMTQKAAADPAIRQQLLPLRNKLNDSVRRNRTPNFSELATIEMRIDDGAEPGLRQLRLQTPLGVSAPLVFQVGQLPEVRERDVKNSPADAERPVSLPVTVNGRLIPGDVGAERAPLRAPNQYAPGDVDRYRFLARRDQQIVVAVSARALMPYLADAVPGWFQAVVAMYDAAGREIAFCDDHGFDPDPVLHARIPADGEYVVEIRDSIYRGREDFVYRVSIGEFPYITSVFPLGGPAGSKTPVEVTGWNLPSSRLTLDARPEPGVYPIAVTSGPLVSNALPFAVGTLPERLEREPNNARNDAQSVSLPAVVNGRIGEPGDWDVFSFKGRAGQIVVAEVTARRLESPLDSVIELTDAHGARIAFNDDREDKAAALVTHQADSYVMAALAADGTYFVRLGDVQRKGGAEYAYRLRLSEPEPDFDLRVSPSTINASMGANVPVSVTAIRRDGFDGDIALTLKDAGGFTVSGGVIPAGQQSVRFTIAPPPVATRNAIDVRVEGRAVLDGRTIVRDAVAADDRMQAFAYHHLVPADDLRVMVAGRGGTRVPARVLVQQPIRIPAGGNVRVHASLPPGYAMFENIQFELSEPPPGMTLGEAAVVGAMANFTIAADAKVPAELRGNLIVLVTGERVPPPNAQAQAPAARRRLPLGALPAIAFEIVR
jgi:hypothetical protein